MVARILFSLVLLFVAVSAHAAKHVAVGATGNGSGSDWNNRMAPPASTAWVRGETYYIAGGAYGSLTFSTPNSGTTRINIIKATEADHGSATGWTSSLGTTRATFSKALFTTGYWTWDGVTGGGPGSWTSGHGFFIQTGQGPGAQFGASAIQCIFKHTEIRGIGNDGNGTPDNDLFYIGGNTVSNTGAMDLLISYCYAHNAGRTIFFSRNDNVTVEFTYTGYFESLGAEHAEIASLGNPEGLEAQNWTFRWCVFTHGKSTGGLIYNGGNLTVHGCVFVLLPGSVWDGQGAVGAWSWSGSTNMKIYNNSFIIVGHCMGQFITEAGGVDAESGEFKNNIFYACDYGEPAGASQNALMLTHTHNHYVDSTVPLPTETNRTSGSGNPFVNYLGLDFRLLSNTAAGANLGAPYNVDMLGNTRTTWTRGAIEFGSSGNPGQIQLETDAYTVSESGTSIIITATRSGGSTGAVGCSYATNSTGTTATAGTDYTAVSNTFSWADGNLDPKTATVNITGDATVEGNETFNFAVSAPTGGATLGTPSSAVITIIDDEAPTIPLMESLSFGAELGLIEGPYVISAGKISQSTSTTTVINGGRARYRVTIPSTGDYKVDVMVNAPSVTADTCWAEFDGEPTEPEDVCDFAVTSGVQSRALTHRGAGTPTAPEFNPWIKNLTAGEHTFWLRGREALVELDTITISALVAPDVSPPIPDPPLWEALPLGDSQTSVMQMTVAAVSDITGPPEYEFDETSGNPGGTDSPWQESRSYIDADLLPGFVYTYRVRARDKVTPTPNVTGYSTSESATTDPPIGTAPVPVVNTPTLNIGQ